MKHTSIPLVLRDGVGRCCLDIVLRVTVRQVEELPDQNREQQTQHRHASDDAGDETDLSGRQRVAPHDIAPEDRHLVAGRGMAIG